MIVRLSLRRALLASTATIIAGMTAAVPAIAAQISGFAAGDLVISTVSSYNGGGLDTAAPIVLTQFKLGAGGTSATAGGTLTLPQTGNGANSAISGEYGSASEGILQRSVNGQYLTIMGYGVNATAFNTAPLTLARPEPAWQRQPELHQCQQPYRRRGRIAHLVRGGDQHPYHSARQPAVPGRQ